MGCPLGEELDTWLHKGGRKCCALNGSTPESQVPVFNLSPEATVVGMDLWRPLGWKQSPHEWDLCSGQQGSRGFVCHFLHTRRQKEACIRKWLFLHSRYTGVLILNPQLPGPRCILATYNPQVYDILFPQFALKQQMDAQNLAFAHLKRWTSFWNWVEVGRVLMNFIKCLHCFFIKIILVLHHKEQESVEEILISGNM